MISYEKCEQFSNGSLYSSVLGIGMHIAVAISVYIEALPSNLVLMDPETRIGIPSWRLFRSNMGSIYLAHTIGNANWKVAARQQGWKAFFEICQTAWIPYPQVWPVCHCSFSTWKRSRGSPLRHHRCRASSVVEHRNLIPSLI